MTARYGARWSAVRDKRKSKIEICLCGHYKILQKIYFTDVSARMQVYPYMFTVRA